MNLRDRIKTKRADILRISARYGARNVRLFGSVTRNEATDQSDIDMLVDMESGRDLLDLIGVEQDLEELMGCQVDILTPEGLSPYLRAQIDSEAVPL